MFVMEVGNVYLLAKILQVIGSFLLAYVTFYTLYSYYRVKPSLKKLASYASKRPLTLPKDWDELVKELVKTLYQLIGGRKLEVLLILVAVGFVLFMVGSAWNSA